MAGKETFQYPTNSNELPIDFDIGLLYNRYSEAGKAKGTHGSEAGNGRVKTDELT